MESLRRRVDELTRVNERYRSENARMLAELEELRVRLSAAEDDVAATRTSLRRMIRERS
jgi:hypothetical protein